MTYEERLQTLIDLELAERATEWSRADAWSQMVKDFGRTCMKDIAATLRKSTEYVRQHVIVAVNFPSEHRYPDVDFSTYREVAQAAKRSKGEVTAVDLLQRVLEQDMAVSEVRLLYRTGDKPPVLRFAKTCRECGRRTIEYAAAEDVDEKILCRKCGQLLGQLEV